MSPVLNPALLAWFIGMVIESAERADRTRPVRLHRGGVTVPVHLAGEGGRGTEPNYSSDDAGRSQQFDLHNRVPPNM